MSLPQTFKRHRTEMDVLCGTQKRNNATERVGRDRLWRGVRQWNHRFDFMHCVDNPPSPQRLTVRTQTNRTNRDYRHFEGDCGTVDSCLWDRQGHIWKYIYTARWNPGVAEKCACSRDSATPRVQLNSLSRDNTTKNQNVPSSPHHSPTSAVFETFSPSPTPTLISQLR